MHILSSNDLVWKRERHVLHLQSSIPGFVASPKMDEITVGGIAVLVPITETAGTSARGQKPGLHFSDFGQEPRLAGANWNGDYGDRLVGGGGKCVVVQVLLLIRHFLPCLYGPC